MTTPPTPPTPPTSAPAWAAGLPDSCTHGSTRIADNGRTYCEECNRWLTCVCGRPSIDGDDIGRCAERCYYGQCGGARPGQYMGD